MIVFKFTFLALQLIYNSVGYLWGKGLPHNLKSEFDQHTILFFKKIHTYNASDFTVAIKPFFIALSLFCLFESYIVGQIIGEKHALVNQMVLLSSASFFLVFIGFRSDKSINDLIQTAKVDMKKWAKDVLNWSFWIGFFVFTTWFIIESLKNPAIKPEEFITGVLPYLSYWYLVLYSLIFIAPALLHVFMWILPVYISRVFSKSMKILVTKSLKEDSTNPFRIIFIVIAALLLIDVFLVMRGQF